MKTPILETKRLLLRPLSVKDAEAAFENWTSDPDIAKFMRWELHENISETREWLAYNIMKKYWNQSLATEAAQEIIDFGKNKLLQKQFYCCHAKENPASGKVMQKIGFQYQNDGEYYSWNKKRKYESKEYLLLDE